MNRLSIASLTAALTLSAGLSAQMNHGPTASTATNPAAEVQGSYNRLKPNILKAAEKMPAEDYQYKPTSDIRTFARVVNHITEAQSHTCSTMLGESFAPSMVPSDTADKAAVLEGLKASFALCDKAYGNISESNHMDGLTFGATRRSRIGAAWGNVSHDNEQYAILSLYLRLKGIAPPTSEK